MSRAFAKSHNEHVYFVGSTTPLDPGRTITQQESDDPQVNATPEAGQLSGELDDADGEAADEISATQVPSTPISSGSKQAAASVTPLSSKHSRLSGAGAIAQVGRSLDHMTEAVASAFGLPSPER
ncbi:hypothetical protein V5O48_006646 [Marasmius crinis-equi]|uniref:Uncharacterized protein n=1 Tax=Marasmius crinis-equi TaxID=585013 RepID=A0ABR3FJ04_9AGAR